LEIDWGPKKKILGFGFRVSVSRFHVSGFGLQIAGGLQHGHGALYFKIVNSDKIYVARTSLRKIISGVGFLKLRAVPIGTVLNFRTTAL
jgi:hypothetical protein